MKNREPDLRRQILEDVLGDNVEEYENFNRENDSKRQHRQRIPLWQFLLHLLNRDKKSEYIEWNRDYELEFRIKDTLGVAELWGSVKNKTDMTYEKLGRAMRYYYGKSIIEKVTGRRYSYRFILSRRTKKYLSQVLETNNMKMQPASDSDHDPLEVESVPDFETITTTTITKKNERKLYSIVEDTINDEKPMTKTKIFKPDRSMFEDLDENFITHLPSDSRNNSLFQNDITTSTATTAAVRRSAFTVPTKINRDNNDNSSSSNTNNNVSCKTKIMKSAPFLENRQAIIRGRKRSFPYAQHEREAIAYCCCGSHNCKVKVVDYSSEDSEAESSYSYGSVSPHDFQTTTNIYPNSRQIYFEQNFEPSSPPASAALPFTMNEFILQKDLTEYRDREESQLLNLQHNLELNKKLDPFMGYDYSDNPFVCDSFDDLLSDGGLCRSNSQLC